jgi:phosphatidate cytidylyltransferase
MTEKMRNLLVRTATGIVLVAMVLAAMVLGRRPYTVLLVWIAAYCITEFWNLARNRREKWLGSLYIVVCMVAMWFLPYLGAGMTGSHLVADGFLASCGVGGCSSGGCIFDNRPTGWNALVAPAFIVIVWANDVFAYLTGMALGKHPMAPKISPKKTWEGFAGGIVGAVAVAVAIGKFVFGAGVDVGAGANFASITGLVLWAAFGLVVALASVGGDLAESWFKRRADVKDSGNAFPGHGGFLDRFDAMLGAAPVAFIFFLITFLVK